MSWKTTLVGLAKILFAGWLIVHKTRTGTDISETDLAIIGLALGGGVGNVLSADSKRP